MNIIKRTIEMAVFATAGIHCAMDCTASHAKPNDRRNPGNRNTEQQWKQRPVHIVISHDMHRSEDVVYADQKVEMEKEDHRHDGYCERAAPAPVEDDHDAAAEQGGNLHPRER